MRGVGHHHGHHPAYIQKFQPYVRRARSIQESVMWSKTGRAPMVTDASEDSSLSRLLLLERCNGTHATLAVLAAPGVAAGAPGVPELHMQVSQFFG